MQDSFEKEVQKKMEEISLTPSAPVWEKVEAEIKVKKRRKKGIYWFFLAGLLLAGGGWWAYQSTNNSHRQLSTQTNTTPLKESVDPVSKSTGTSDITTDSVNPGAINLHTLTNNKQKHYLQDKQTIEQVPIRKQDKQTFNKTPVRVSTDATNKLGQTVYSSITEEDKKPDKQFINDKQTEIKKTLDKKQTSGNTNIMDSVNVVEQQFPSLKDSAVKPENKKEETVPVVTDSLFKKKIAANSKKWKKQINVGAGWSNYIEAPSFNYSAANVSQSTGLSFNGPFEPQKTKAGFGFSIGFSLSKQLGKKWELAVGLQYAHYSTNTKVGDKKTIDTTVRFNMDKASADEFFTNTGKTNYTHRFHVVELPVSVSYQPSTKLPLYFSIGAAYGRLLSTNALTFSNTSNLYYQNNDNYFRNTLPVSSSIQVRLFSKKGVAIRVGPSIQYNLLKLRKENVTNKPHLFFAGIKTGINF